MGVRIIRWRNVGIAIIVIAAIVICAAPLVTVPYVVAVSYEDTETYYTEEAYTVQEPYIDKECIYRDYDAKGGYISDNWKGDWAILYSLFDTAGNPYTSGTNEFYIKNYEDRLGEFTVRINFWDANDNFVEAFDYRTISVGPGETEYGYISLNYLWENKPGTARSYNVRLDVPQLEECESITVYEPIIKYRDVEKQRTVTKTRQETRYKKVTVLEYLINYA